MKSVATALVGLVLVGVGATAAPAPTTYRVTFDYYYQTLAGDTHHRERIIGTYTRDWQKSVAMWADVSAASAKGDAGAFGEPEAQVFMQGFSYPLHASAMTSDTFFRHIASAISERTLVWDTRMFEIFGEEQLDRLKANEPYHASRNEEVALAGAGTFTNNDAQLTLTGRTVLNGEECAVVDYRALFNHFQLKLPGSTLVGRSHYWGQIWVSRKDKHAVRATLYEDVLGEAAAGAGLAPQPVNVLRIGTVDRVSMAGRRS